MCSRSSVRDPRPQPGAQRRPVQRRVDPVGRHHSVLWTSDGRVTQTVPVIIDLQERC
ncbi:DUF5980 family protein [Plantactinospora veratri]|uniref:DUF5980 family protein n=1 Tax=Plantactinospora veratri TaxID=1436122 RepID=UPI0038B4388E